MNDLQYSALKGVINVYNDICVKMGQYVDLICCERIDD